MEELNMTFSEKIKSMLTQCGMFDDMAEKVLEMVKADPANEVMKNRWNDRVSDYPQVMENIMWLAAKKSALEYIEENCPNAWFKPVFELFGK